MVPALRREYPHVLIVPRHDAWLDTLVLVAEEMMKRIDISAQCEALEQSARSGRKYATLGQYMVDMRHGFNNALTSVLGNAELLLLESGVLTADMREQLETLHAMTLRLHEMMQRFTSLELEMRCSERSARSDSDGMAASVSAGA
jgi:signal transduction histidine kinase